MKQFLISVILFSLSFLYFSCEATDPSIQIHKIEITQQDVSVTEAYIRIRVESPLTDGKIILFKNGNVNKIISPIAADTVVTDTAVTESTQYEYKAQIVRNDFMLTESEPISIQTLKPTSHEVLWTLYEFDSPGGSVTFNDIKIINEDDIWVAGKIFDADSDGVYRHPPSNAIHWNGSEWETKTLKFKYFYGEGRPTTTAILAFNSNDIILASSHSVKQYNGEEWVNLKLFSDINGSLGSAYTLWGTSSDNFYAGGVDGKFIKWDGVNWNSIELGITSEIVDIVGVTQNYSNFSTLYVAAFYMDQEPPFDDHMDLLRINENHEVKKINFGQRTYLTTVWTNTGYPIYTGGTGMYSNKKGRWEIINGTENQLIGSIRGDGLNDIFAIGKGIMHFNGLEWHKYSEYNNNFFSLFSMDIKENVIAISGWLGVRPVVIIGKRI